jgi:hypothetical protein
MNLKGLIRLVVLLTMALTLLLPEVSVSATESSTTVSVSLPQTVGTGEQFTVDIVVNPESEIAGVQFSLFFDPLLVTVNSVSEGNLFKQSGMNSYFIPGEIDSITGMIRNVAGVSISPGRAVSSSGVLATVVFTSKLASGVCPLVLFDVIVGNIEGKAVPVNLINGQVSIGGLLTKPTKIVGTIDTTRCQNESGNFLILTRFKVEVTATLSLLRIKANSIGHIKCAVYQDISGEPGSKLTSSDLGQFVDPGWNNIDVPDISLKKDTYFWLGILTDGLGVVQYKYTTGPEIRFRRQEFSGFAFPNTLVGLVKALDYETIISGWYVP